MDPVSQGAVGAAFAQTASTRERVLAFSIIGALAGMAPDLDVLIQSPTDPLLFLEYHRHFTHALIFIPFGALIVAAVMNLVPRNPLTFRQTYLASLIGYATHGLLDACTSYGTQLFWPFSDQRVAWNNISVVDPFVTVPLLVLIAAAVWRKNKLYTSLGLAWLIGYLLLGVWQNQRAVDAGFAIAQARGHNPTHVSAKPSFANIILWKTIYEHDGYYYVDGARVTTESTHCPGARIEKLDLARHFPALNPNSQTARDIERFRWFSQDHLAPFEDGRQIIDIRYSNLPTEIEPLWGIAIDPQAAIDDHVAFWPNRRVSEEQMTQLGKLIDGTACAPIGDL
ncbi:MAG: metal-dependent hydrolase [Pseudomonadota bacterium]